MAWHDSGVEQVGDGVYRIPIPLPGDGLRAVNTYAVLGGARPHLVDAGINGTASLTTLTRALAVLDVRPDDLGRCVVTHCHTDHYTLGAELRREFGTQLSLGEGEAPNLAMTRAGGPRHSAQVDALLRCGAEELVQQLRPLFAPPNPFALDYPDPDCWLRDGELVDLGSCQLRVLATPGHTRGHVALVDDVRGTAFTGDHLLPHITPSIGLEAAPAVSPLADYLASLARVLTEPDRHNLPAHGPVSPSVHRRALELLSHHEERLQIVEKSVAAGEGTAYLIAQKMTWTRRQLALGVLDAFNQMLAVLEVMSHLTVLEAQTRVASRLVDGILEFSS